MSINLAAHVSTWINEDDPKLGADTPFETVLAQVAGIGFAGLELGQAELPARLAAAQGAGVRIIAARHGLNLLQTHMAEEKARITPLLELLRAAGVRVLIAHETTESIHTDPRAPLSERPELPEHLWQPFGAAIEEMAGFANGYGVALMYHPHLGTMVQTPAEVSTLMAHTGPATGLVFDSAQIAYAGGDPQALLESHIDRIGHMHLGNVRPRVMDFGRANDWPFLAAIRAGVFTAPGDPDGGLDLDAMFDLVLRQGFDGWVVPCAPQDPALYVPENYMTMAHRALDNRLGGKAQVTT